MNLKIFRQVAILEGISWVLLLVTMAIKYGMDIFWPNKIVGYAHGFLFMAYIFFLLYFLYTKKWKFQFGIIVFVASLIPFGTFYLDAKYLKKM